MPPTEPCPLTPTHSKCSVGFWSLLGSSHGPRRTWGLGSCRPRLRLASGGGRPVWPCGGRPFQSHNPGGFGQGWPGSGPACSMVHSHLVTGQQVLGGLQVRAGLTHEDVPLAGGGPNGLRRGAAVDLPALTAGEVEQGQLAQGGGWSALGRRQAAGRGWAAPRPPAWRGAAHLPSRSCPAPWRQPDAPASAAGSSRGCTGRRSAWPR